MKKRFVIVFVVFLTVSYTLIANQSPVIISEFMAFNSHVLTDEDGEYSDWIELFNQSETNVNLTGWYLTDDQAVLTKWCFPNVVLAQGEYLLCLLLEKIGRAM
jgi:hypothetical protein